MRYLFVVLFAVSLYLSLADEFVGMCVREDDNQSLEDVPC